MMSNKTSHLSSSCASSSLVTLDVVISCLFFSLFPIALLLNGVAAWVSLHLRSTSTFIVYLKNLVAADLLLTLTLPPMAASLLPGATVRLRAFCCRFSDVIFYCSLYTSIALMGLISLDRFFKIVRPCGMVLGQNVLFSTVMSTLVWVGLFGSTAIPTMILTNRGHANKSGDFCMSLKSRAATHLHVYVVLSMETLFWFFSLLIVFCYICITIKVLQSFRNSRSTNSKGKTKTKLRVFLILLVYFVCFLPLHITRIPFTLNEVLNIDVCTDTWVEILHRLAIWISTTNACMDPILYIFLCREYRDKLFDMMKRTGMCVGLYSNEREEISLEEKG